MVLRVNLYETLGLDRDATDGEIKAAYRRKAKATHPDAGGDRDQFEAVNQAWLVLRNPKKRAHYDRTGEIPDSDLNPDAPAMTCLATTFETVMNAIMSKGADLAKSDIIGLMRQVIQHEIAHRVEARNNAKADLKAWRGMRERFSVTEGKENRLAGFVDAKIGFCEQAIAQGDELDAVARAALEILEDHAYAFDEPEPVMQGIGYGIGSGTAAGVFGRGIFG